MYEEQTNILNKYGGAIENAVLRVQIWIPSDTALRFRGRCNLT